MKLPSFTKLTKLPSKVPMLLAARRRRGAIGFPIVYLLFGGGLFGAVVIYLIVKMLGG
jgi:hypothetical protein